MKITAVFLFIMLALGGCSTKEISNAEFNVIWQEYLKREFEESFDEKQSTSQREKILQDILKEFKVDFEYFKEYMIKEHKEKYHALYHK